MTEVVHLNLVELVAKLEIYLESDNLQFSFLYKNALSDFIAGADILDKGLHKEHLDYTVRRLNELSRDMGFMGPHNPDEAHKELIRALFIYTTNLIPDTEAYADYRRNIMARATFD